jgi:predicted porin
MRGSEDLGGGMKANFHVESDLLTNTGNTHSSGLFRRAANVSLADANLGEVFLGRRGNAYILATAQMLPVSGNTAHQWRNVIQSSVGDQISNSVTYATPTVMATNVVVQYGMNNTVDNGDDGTMFAAHLVNKSISNLQLTAAYNIQKAQNSVTANNTSIPSSTNSVSTAGQNREGYAVGLKYKVTPAIEVGTFYAHGRTNNGYANAVATTGITQGAGGLGVGYQATPAILLGANYVKTTMDAAMTNLQAHYALSKRTRLYSQITLTQKATGNYQLGTLAANGFSPTACNSSSASCMTGLPGTAGNQNTPTNANGYNVGIIHTF